MSWLKHLSAFFQKIQQLGFRLGPSVYARHPSLLCRCITRVLKIGKSKKGSKKVDISNFSDSELLSLLTQSDQEAFSAIYDRYASILYIHIINEVCTHRTVEQAQDDTVKILIRIFASLWNDREKPVVHKTLQEYLFSIAYRKLVNYKFVKEAFTYTD